MKQHQLWNWAAWLTVHNHILLKKKKIIIPNYFLDNTVPMYKEKEIRHMKNSQGVH